MKALQSLLIFLLLGSATALRAQNNTVCIAAAESADAGKTQVDVHIDPGTISSVTKVEIWKPIPDHPQGGVWDPITPTTSIDTDIVTIDLPRKAVAGDKYRVTLSCSTPVRSYNTTFK